MQISNEWGTAVVVQQMIFGNLKDTSGSGVTFTQNPKMRKQGVELYGDYTLRSQGEDIVAGLVKPMHINNNLTHVLIGPQKNMANNKQPQTYRKEQLVRPHDFKFFTVKLLLLVITQKLVEVLDFILDLVLG